VSDDGEINDEVEAAAQALDALIAAHLAAGGSRFVVAAACVWGGVKEVSAVTSAHSAAAALRAIASQLDPPMEMSSGLRGGSPPDDPLMAAVRDQVRRRPSEEDAQLAPMNLELARDVIGEALDMIDQAQPDHARALLMALRARLVTPKQPQAAAALRRRWGM
jgi:hypothetical protein